MKLRRIFSTTPCRRFLLALIPLLVVDLILVPISLLAGSPTAWGILWTNALVILILALRFTLLFFGRLRCRACGRVPARDTGRNDHGYPVVKCPHCGRTWLL